MEKSFKKILKGYQGFRKKYAQGDQSIMHTLSRHGQKPQIMVVACCDSRVDPALILQCDPGDLFVVRNVANIVPPYEKDDAHHGTSAALEFGVCFLKVKHLILLGHSQCGGIKALLNSQPNNDDFITNWVSLMKQPATMPNETLSPGKKITKSKNIDDYAKVALQQSLENCLNFPWIQEKVASEELVIHLWFFDIKTGQIFRYSEDENKYIPLD